MRPSPAASGPSRRTPQSRGSLRRIPQIPPTTPRERTSAPFLPGGRFRPLSFYKISRIPLELAVHEPSRPIGLISSRSCWRGVPTSKHVYKAFAFPKPDNSVFRSLPEVGIAEELDILANLWAVQDHLRPDPNAAYRAAGPVLLGKTEEKTGMLRPILIASVASSESRSEGMWQ